MGASLRILLIDDDPDDRSLVQRTLRPEFPDLLVTEIPGSEDLARALDGAMPDLVITDYQLRWTDGLAVLRAVKDRWPDAPVLMVTGTGSELIAVEAMKAGLDDYVLKAPHHLIRLPAAARAALERAAQRRALRESEARYRALFESSIDAILLTAPDGRILAANPEACRMIRRTEEEICQGGRAGVVDPTDPRLPDLLEERARTGKARGQLTFVRKDGTTFPGEITSAVFTDRDGLAKTSMIIRDITERKRAEDDLRRQREDYQLILDSMPAMVVYTDKGHRVVRANKMASQIIGLSVAELIGKRIHDLFPKEDADRYCADNETVMASGRPKLGIVEQFRTAAGEVRWAHTDKIPLRNDLGDIAGVIIFVVDVTERKRVEEEARSLARFPSENPSPILRVAREGAILYANAASGPLLDRWGSQVGQALPEEARTWIDEAFRTGTSREVEVTCDERVFSLILVPMVDNNYVNLYGRDITERHRAEETLAARTRQLETIRAVSEEITRELGLTTLLSLIVQRAAELIGTRAGTIALWDEPTQTLIQRAWIGLGDWIGDVRIKLGEWVLGTIAKRREGMIINDCRTSPFVHPVVLERSAITATLGEPLLYRDRLVGVITLSHLEPGKQFTEDDRRVLSLFTAQAAIAIENARLYEMSRQYAATLEQRVAERTAELRRTVNLMAGREVRMAELKEVIRTLRTQLEAAGLTPAADDPLGGGHGSGAEGGRA